MKPATRSGACVLLLLMFSFVWTAAWAEDVAGETVATISFEAGSLYLRPPTGTEDEADVHTPDFAFAVYEAPVDTASYPAIGRAALGVVLEDPRAAPSPWTIYATLEHFINTTFSSAPPVEGRLKLSGTRVRLQGVGPKDALLYAREVTLLSGGDAVPLALSTEDMPNGKYVFSWIPEATGGIHLDFPTGYGDVSAGVYVAELTWTLVLH